ncbi:DUF3073 domain-containing protein [Janibacter sp. RAF52]|uniref:DUF3073 domain-containing protein n=1 Tax=unclassified Janibacter TaxID=2649294 RepID=UPI003F93416B
MGRGRAKAKQTKVARELKYYSPETDLRALETELHGQSAKSTGRATHDDAHDRDEDEYDDWSPPQR